MKKSILFSLLIQAITIFSLSFPLILTAQTTSILESSLGTAWGPTECVVPVVVSPDGKYLAKYYSVSTATKYNKAAIQLFDLQTFHPVKYFTNTFIVHYMIFTPDSKKLITASEFSSIITIWDVKTGEKIKEFDAGHYSTSIDITPDGKYLLLGSGGGLTLKTTVVDIENTSTILTIKTGRYTVARFASGGKHIISTGGQGGGMVLWDATSGQKIDEFAQSLESFSDFLVNPDGTTFTASTIQVANSYSMGGNGSNAGTNNTYFCKIDQNKIVLLKTLRSLSRDVVFGTLSESVFLIDDFSLSSFSLKTGEKINSFQFKEVTKGRMIFTKEKQKLSNIVSINNGNHLIITDNRGVSYIYSVKENIIQAFLYTYGDKDYAIVTPDGRMEGTTGAIEKLQWRQGNKTVQLSNTFEQMYTPNLLAQIFEEKLEVNKVNIDNLVSFTPSISFVSPKTGFKATNPNLNIQVGIIENGEEVTQIRIFVNDKIVNEDVRGFKAIGKTISYDVAILPGKNSIKAVAISKSGYQSTPAEIQVEYAGATAESKLYVLAIGIDQYKNKTYCLNYAVADAKSFSDKLKSSGSDIFKTQEVIVVLDGDATLEKINLTFSELINKIQPQDAFIMFYAGHGVMSEGTPDIPKDFYLALCNVTQLYGKDEMLKENGLSATELREYCKKIQAQKQVILLDACQSGGAVETFAMRGAAEEKAILQLARSTGSVLIASTGTEQFASEFKDLGHGVFTYALLEGLNGKADGGEKDRKITIKELEAFLNDYIPVLSEKYHGSAQYPKTWSKGMDFPIGVVK